MLTFRHIAIIAGIALVVHIVYQRIRTPAVAPVAAPLSYQPSPAPAFAEYGELA